MVVYYDILYSIRFPFYLKPTIKLSLSRSLYLSRLFIYPRNDFSYTKYYYSIIWHHLNKNFLLNKDL